jgi:hypothetical protein
MIDKFNDFISRNFSMKILTLKISFFVQITSNQIYLKFNKFKKTNLLFN